VIVVVLKVGEENVMWVEKRCKWLKTSLRNAQPVVTATRVFLNVVDAGSSCLPPSPPPSDRT